MKRKRQLPHPRQGGKTPKEDQQPVSSTGSGSSSMQAEEGAPGISRSRRWLFRGLLAFVLPLLALLFLETMLRLAGYGHPTSFLLLKRIHGKEMLVDNPWFGLRFFPPALARSPSAVSISANKPPGVYRIFLLGESAALGDPRPAYGVGRYLQTLLSERFPGTEFEVVCVAMTAINSHAILPIARECSRYQGDLWVVYMGNNEFAGPFGANTVFGAQVPPVSAVRAYLALESLRVGQWLVNSARALHLGRATPSSWGGLKMFMNQQLPPADPRRERVYRNFRRNLDDLVDTATRAGVPILLSTVASNLKDCPPFGSYGSTDNSSVEANPSQNSAGSSSGTANSKQPEWQTLCASAQAQAGQGNYPAAILDYNRALQLNPDSAEAQFRLGECFLATTNFHAARRCFGLARDLDTLPFRADSRLNELVADAAKRNSSDGVLFVDAEQALATLSTNHIPGSEAFYEHVHLNWDGNYRLALAVAEQAVKALPAAITNRQAGNWASPAECAAQLALTDWNRYPILEEIIRRMSEPPFIGQLNHDARLDELATAMRQLRVRMDRSALDQARQVYETALSRHPQDHWLHHNYAEFLSNIGDLPAATEQMRIVCDLLPENQSGFFQLARLLARQQKFEEARACLETCLRLRPDTFDVRLELGQLLAAQGKLEEALSQYALAERVHGEDDARLRFLQAQVFERQNKRSEAISALREAVRLRPTYWEAHELLGMDLALTKQYPAAQAEFEEVVRLRPTYAEGHLNLGIALARQQHFDQALGHFETTLRLDPENQRAQSFVATIHQMEAQQHSP